MQTFKLRLFVWLLGLICSVPVCAQLKVYSLNSDAEGVEWQLAPLSDTDSIGRQISTCAYQLHDAIPAVVPGVVFTSYVNAGCEQDPTVGSNIYKVDETKYNRPFWYQCRFTKPDGLQSGQHVWLCFDNTNRYADFYLNGHKISGTETSIHDTDGHMLRTQIDVTQYLEDRNTLAVLIYDTREKKTRKSKEPFGVTSSPTYLAAAGWDWMPYVPGRLNGIPGRVRLCIAGEVRMRDPWIRSYLQADGSADLSVKAELQNSSSKQQQVELKGVIQPGDIPFSQQISIPAGETRPLCVDAKQVPGLSLQHPQLWWPNGYGDPFLYTCHLQVCRDGQVLDERDIRFGVRKFEYRYETNQAGMPVLNLLCNGHKIFVRGGNWGMSEFLLRMHGKQYETPIRLHKQMNYNMIRLWTGCVTDDEFYDYCDQMGIMVWNDFWLYFSFNDVDNHEAFKQNARDKVRRLRNHACIALWCGANETHPCDELDKALRTIVMEEDGNDRLYKACSNQDALSGSGWWKDMPPRHHFETSGSNLAFNKPAYPYSDHYGYGFRTEIGMCTFPTYESTIQFIPKKDQWPLPADSILKDSDWTVWNHHFYGKEALNADPAGYRQSIYERYGEAHNLKEFCDRAQLINLEDMKGMYEAWNDKMWQDAAGLMIWMSHPAYPSFVWQTYDYYYEPTGCYWGARSACEPVHIQWNCLTGSVKVINTTLQSLSGYQAEAIIYDLQGQQVGQQAASISVQPNSNAQTFTLDLSHVKGMCLIRLMLKDKDGKEVSRNCYWTNTLKDLDYTALNQLPKAKLQCQTEKVEEGQLKVTLQNTGKSIAFATHLQLLNPKTKQRILPAVMSDGYVTLMPGESQIVTIEVEPSLLKDGYKLQVMPYNN